MNKKPSTKMIYTFGAFGGFLFGYDIGIINGALPSIKDTWDITPLMEGTITSILFLGAMAGAVSMAPLADKFGRKMMIMITAIIFALGSLACAFSGTPELLVVSRFILGISVGAASALVPMYMGEISPPALRGQISGLNQLMITIGMLVSYGVNYAFIGVFEGWRWMLGGAVVPAIVLFVGAFLLPESPRYLVKKGFKDLALKNLQRLRTSKEAKKEYDEIITMHEQVLNTDQKFKWTKAIGFSLMVGCSVTFLQQIQGANTIFYYSSQILGDVFGSTISGVISTVGVGVVFVVATIITLLVVDRFKRRTLFMTGSLGMGTCLLLVGLIYPYTQSGYTWAITLVFVFICLYVIFYAYSWAAVTWIVVGELFPSNVRGMATGIASMVNWLGNIVVALFFPILMSSIGLSSIFFLFAAICAIGFLFAKYVLYETNGKTLEEIELYLDNRFSNKKIEGHWQEAPSQNK
ncbi:sugar porter family MFS transporter [Salinicoccus roseus]|uniref:sugar porter family MFS transporter n=1 Tax=Salinicoccus roseus TaxID=45670 RepID=UPI000F509984|nr:sugar porter family MFS transporter [Salinicoccus roseus]RPE54659.1 sugar porter (SP) family MFS transporter [Salinicoccus roseus]GGA63774.1 MFS transporter [Salinicoccus roseus]